MRHEAFSSRLIAISGCRHWKTDEQKAIVRNALGSIGRDKVGLVGDCPSGVDLWVREFFTEMGVQHLEAKALWDSYGKAAGPMRNHVLAEICGELVAFWDGRSTGTRSTIIAALNLGKHVTVFDAKGGTHGICTADASSDREAIDSFWSMTRHVQEASYVPPKTRRMKVG